MSTERLRCLLVADFTIDNLAGLLANDEAMPLVEAVTAPYEQVAPVLLNAAHPAWSPRPDVTMIWTRPERVSESFARLLDYEDVPLENILAEVDRFADQVTGIHDRTRLALVPTWTMPHYHRGYGLLDMKPGLGHAAVLMQMNLRLAERLAGSSNTFFLDAGRWMAQAGPRASNPKLWFMGKVTFGNDVFVAAMAALKAAVNAAFGRSRKLVVVDLDDTLWGGILGDIGRDQIRLGGHDPIGEAFASFQRGLKALRNRGILLGIVSKNVEETALEAIDNHPEMVLRREHFAGWRINWSDKAQNLAELTAELNLGLQSVVFIDDNPVECDRVRSTLPEVLVPEWPTDPMLYLSTLEALDCFDTVAVSGEDRNRAQMYAAERRRQDLMGAIGSVDDWLASLQMQVTVEPLNDTNRERAVQLLNKTNQMNLTTRRMTAAELESWLENPCRRLWTFRVADKFGDAGLTGICSCELDGDRAKIVDFVLSCRVMGRKVEETMLHMAISWARAQRATYVEARPIATEKNGPCRDFFAASSFKLDQATGTYSWSTSADYPVPPPITLQQ